MANPYEAPKNSSQPAFAAPYWYVLFHQFHQPVWWIGTALIVGSWFKIVSPSVGWIGFALACAIALGALVLPPLAGVKREDVVILDARLISSKGEAYFDAMNRFSNGATLVYEGTAFGLRINDEIACRVIADSPNINEEEAFQISEHAQSIFDTLTQNSPEFAAAVNGKTFRVSVISSQDPNATELYRFVDGYIQ